MRHRLIVFLFVIVLLVLAPTGASAQYRSHWTNPVASWQMATSGAINQSLGLPPGYGFYGGYYGYMDGGYFYGTHDRYGRPLSRMQRFAVGASIGGAIGSGVGQIAGGYRGSAAGGLIGTGVGALMGVMTGNRSRAQVATRQLPYPSLPMQMPQTPPVAESSVATVYRDSDAVGGEIMVEEWELVNGTEDPPRPILVYDRGRAIRWVQPGESLMLQVPMGKARFKAVAYRQAKTRTFEVRDVAIPLEIEKEEGRPRLIFTWPREVTK